MRIIKHHFLVPFYMFLIAFVFQTCAKQKGKINHGDFPSEIGTIIANKCATSGCHNSKSSVATNNYNLDSWDLMFKGSNSGSPVIPFNSAYSSLCFYINTYDDLGLKNEPTMPLNAKALSYDEVKVIKNWIDDGAAN